MDMCHLKNAELETKHQKYKGRVVLRGDMMKDDSGTCAVFTEQGSSASQMFHSCGGALGLNKQRLGVNCKRSTSAEVRIQNY